VEIVFHAHHAVISDELRARAERAVHKAAARLHRAVDAIVRFEEDGPTRRVEIVLNAPRHGPVVAVGEGRQLSAALTAALARLQAQVGKGDAPRARARRPRGAVGLNGAGSAESLAALDLAEAGDDGQGEPLDDEAAPDEPADAQRAEPT
jgi:ribosome-associated translation inhibitor RaiA